MSEITTHWNCQSFEKDTLFYFIMHYRQKVNTIRDEVRYRNLHTTMHIRNTYKREREREILKWNFIMDKTNVGYFNFHCVTQIQLYVEMNIVNNKICVYKYTDSHDSNTLLLYYFFFLYIYLLKNLFCFGFFTFPFTSPSSFSARILFPFLVRHFV